MSGPGRCPGSVRRFASCSEPAIVSAGLRILGDGQVEPGSAFAAQLDCACDVVAPVGERFIVRSMSPVMTIGGGRILDNNPAKHRRSDQHAVARLARLASGNTADVIHELIQAREDTGNRDDGPVQVRESGKG